MNGLDGADYPAGNLHRLEPLSQSSPTHNNLLGNHTESGFLLCDRPSDESRLDSCIVMSPKIPLAYE